MAPHFDAGGGQEAPWRRPLELNPRQRQSCRADRTVRGSPCLLCGRSPFGAAQLSPAGFRVRLSLLVLQALMIERGLSAGVLVFGVLQFLVYPHLAYLHARLAPDSRPRGAPQPRRRLRDARGVGGAAAFSPVALLRSSCRVCLNNAPPATEAVRLRGGLVRRGRGSLGAVLGYPFEPHTGPLVSGLCLAGIVGYTSWMARSSTDRTRT